MEKLLSIDQNSLNKFNKKYYQLINIKVHDKAGIYNESDSLILNLIDYFKNTDYKDLFAESLYYGGRRFAQKGDLPSALSYYRKALEVLPNNNQVTKIRSNINYQIADILNTLRMHQEAIPYLKKCLKYDKFNKDSLYELYTMQLIGANYIHLEEYDSAEWFINKSRKLAEELYDDKLIAIEDTYLAKINLEKNDINTALQLINNALRIEKRNFVLAHAINIYYAAGNYDTVAKYAYQLINSENNHNKLQGYQKLLTPELQQYLPNDSLRSYVQTFYNLMEEKLNLIQDEFELIQTSQYNYKNHEQRRIKAEKSRERLTYWLFGVGIIVLLLIIVILGMNARTNKQKMTLMRERDVIAELNRKLRQMEENEASRQKAAEPEKEEGISTLPLDQNVKELRKLVMKEYAELQRLAKKRADVPPAILKSKAYAETRGYLADQMMLPENSDIWDDLERVVEKCSPGFKVRLRTLMGGKLKAHDLHAALLIKCGFSPTALTVLLGRSKGSISSQRGELCLRLVDERGGAAMADAIISLL